MEDFAEEMYVIKRNGKKEIISFDKILRRVKTICKKQNITINCPSLVMKVIDQLHNDIETTKIDELTAQQCANLCTLNPDYGKLAAHIIISNHHKNTTASFTEAMNRLHGFKDVRGIPHSLISDKLWAIAKQNITVFNKLIDYDRDFEIDYFGFKTLEKSYLMKVNGKCVERPQHMWLRVAIGIHGDDIERVTETYELLSRKYFTHATPTLFNAGTNKPQLSSCYLLGMEDDSIEGIYNTLKDTALISKYAGGIGLHIHNVRASSSHIRGTNGTSNGIVPMLKVFNNTARYVDQGGGRRNGSFAIYLEPWHLDIEDFLEMKKNHGDEEGRARDLFYGLWVPDLFMKRVAQEDGKWLLCCPNECGNLSDYYGDEFEREYTKYERLHEEGKLHNSRVINARELWFKILDSQMETGNPYLLYKDAANKKSNQKNLGTIKSSNLCTEIIEYSDSKESAVCNLASIGLSRFVKPNGEFDYELLFKVTRIVTFNLNRVIDVNFYPTVKTQRSNRLHRPIGIGVQGLADVFILMDLPFCSDEARDVNKRIFETIYFAAVTESNEISKSRWKDMERLRVAYNDGKFMFSDVEGDIPDNNETKLTIGKKNEEYKELHDLLEKYRPIWAEMNSQGKAELAGSYSSFLGSPASKGILQFDMWDEKHVSPCGYVWEVLKESVQEYGMRNSLLVAPMPTASTSQILGNNECFEPITSNIYSRRTGAGEFVIANKYLIRELLEMGIWNDEIKNNIIENKGSIQHIDIIPERIREKYKIVWEMPMKRIIEMSADRGRYICQSQSLNLWMEDPTYKTLTSMHFYGWKQGLKTGIYYLRRKPKHAPQQFTIKPKSALEDALENTENYEICEMCSS
jgi:ribonucleoside-diphosphate reductase alpha subunit